MINKRLEHLSLDVMRLQEEVEKHRSAIGEQVETVDELEAGYKSVAEKLGQVQRTLSELQVSHTALAAAVTAMQDEHSSRYNRLRLDVFYRLEAFNQRLDSHRDLVLDHQSRFDHIMQEAQASRPPQWSQYASRAGRYVFAVVAVVLVFLYDVWCAICAGISLLRRGGRPDSGSGCTAGGRCCFEAAPDLTPTPSPTQPVQRCERGCGCGHRDPEQAGHAAESPTLRHRSAHSVTSRVEPQRGATVLPGATHELRRAGSVLRTARRGVTSIVENVRVLAERVRCCAGSEERRALATAIDLHGGHAVVREDRRVRDDQRFHEAVNRGQMPHAVAACSPEGTVARGRLRSSALPHAHLHAGHLVGPTPGWD